MELFNEKLLEFRENPDYDTSDLSFTNEPKSIGIATRKEENGQIEYIVYANNERGCREWSEEFSDYSNALNFSITMWKGMEKAYSRFSKYNNPQKTKPRLDSKNNSKESRFVFRSVPQSNYKVTLSGVVANKKKKQIKHLGKLKSNFSLKTVLKPSEQNHETSQTKKMD